MENKTEVFKDKNGVEYTKTTTVYTPKDGFVPESEIRPLKPNTYGQYRYGYTVKKSYSTDDPKIIALFVYPLIAFFILLGIGISVGGLLASNMSIIVMGLFFFAFSVYCLFAFIKEQKRNKEKFKEKHNSHDDVFDNDKF